MPTETRNVRSFGVTGSLRPEQRQHLLALINSEVWTDLLDVMEMTCIEIETRLINTEADNEAAVLANHKMSKAAWVIFTQFQATIAKESQVFFDSQQFQPQSEPISQQEQWREHLLNPTREAPDEGDYFGI